MAVIIFFKGNQLSLKTLERKLKKNPTTYKIVSEGKTDKTFSQIFSFTGGFLVGYSLAQLITTGKLNPYILGSGAAFVGIALPFGSSYEKRLKKAILIYNSELN